MNVRQGHLELRFDEERLRDVLRHLYASNKALKVGILENATNADTGASIAEYAYFNEFGTKNIPARPFLETLLVIILINGHQVLKISLKRWGLQIEM